MTKEQLLQKLSQEFNSANIVILRDLTKKIAIISKVRIGDKKKRDYTEYDEISLYNIDPYGVVYIPEDAKRPEPANYTSVVNQTLRYGDLVLNQRTSKMKVGFIGKEESYQRRIVGNNSMIRIQFHNRSIDTARFVQLYLQLPYVLEYLNALPSCSKSDRKILSSTQLQELPIPEYIEKEQLISLSEVLYPKMELLRQAREMKEIAEGLIEKYEAAKMGLVGVNFQDELTENIIESDAEEIRLIEDVRKSFRELPHLH